MRYVPAIPLFSKRTCSKRTNETRISCEISSLFGSVLQENKKDRTSDDISSQSVKGMLQKKQKRLEPVVILAKIH